MKKKLLALLLSALLLIIAGCGGQCAKEEQSAEETAAEAPAEPEVVYPEWICVANDDFSNLQLDNVTTPVYDKYTLAERKEKGLPTVIPQLTPYTQGKIAYLTFDDGPDPNVTVSVLDALKEAGVKATFYVQGQHCKGYPEILKRIYNEGHAIGHHSYNHEYDQVYASTDAYLAQLQKTDEVIKQILGVRPFILRTPGGKVGFYNDAYLKLIADNGFVEHDWNIDSGDATGMGYGPDALTARVMSQLDHNGYTSAIILMHSTCGKQATAQALPGIIAGLKARGYSFGVMTPMTPQPY